MPCTPARPRPTPTSSSSPARTPPTACTESRQPERLPKRKRGDKIARRTACFRRRAWATIDGKAPIRGWAPTRLYREDVMKRLGFGLALLCLAFGAVSASAQDKYPSKPVKVLVPYAPGGATDITSRLFGEQMRQSLGQQFVVESKPGAFGIL